MAGSAFDFLQRSVVATVETLYGVSATWRPANGGPAYTGLVLFNTPTDIERRTGGQAGYTEPQWEMEYFTGAFPGLAESVEAAQVVEVVEVDGVAYDVRHITLDFDGKTYKASLNPTVDI